MAALSQTTARGAAATPAATVLARQAALDGWRRWLFGSVAALVGLGLVLVYAASAVRAEQSFGWSLFFVRKQLLWIGIGTLALVAAWLLDYRWLLRLRWALLALGLGLLAAVLVPGLGVEVNGARRWFRLGGYSVQPSDAAKLILVAALAGLLARHGSRLRESFACFLGLAALPVAAAGLIAAEPDFGTAVLIGTVLAAMVYVAGARLRHALLAGLLGLPVLAAGVAWRYESLARRFGYVWERIAAWAEGGSTGKAWHAWMSVQSLKSGGLEGAGPGQGWAKRWYLPEAHTDFIFAVAGQEFGLVCTLAVVLLFGILIVCGARIAREVPDSFGATLVFGLTLMLGLQAAFNIAVVTAAIPTKGISLPFVSFGGSGLISAMAMVGLIGSVTRHSLAAEVRLARDGAGTGGWGAHLLAGLLGRTRRAASAEHGAG
jgi:cell division protein FtsW